MTRVAWHGTEESDKCTEEEEWVDSSLGGKNVGKHIITLIEVVKKKTLLIKDVT